jgi:hypothetical protein
MTAAWRRINWTPWMAGEEMRCIDGMKAKRLGGHFYLTEEGTGYRLGAIV